MWTIYLSADTLMTLERPLYMVRLTKLALAACVSCCSALCRMLASREISSDQEEAAAAEAAPKGKMLRTNLERGCPRGQS